MKALTFLVCGPFLLAFCTTATAAPVTLRFEAEIGTIAAGLPFDSGIEYSLGDIVTGQMTFEPVVGNGGMLFESQQPFDFQLNINGVELAAPSFTIESVDGAAITDFPPADHIDSLTLAGGGLSPIVPDSLPNLDAESSGFRMALFGPTSAIQQVEVPASVATWNDFSLWRQLSVSFRDGNGGAVGFQASVGSFAVVPEPSTIFVSLAPIGIYPVVTRRVQSKEELR